MPLERPSGVGTLPHAYVQSLSGQTACSKEHMWLSLTRDPKLVTSNENEDHKSAMTLVSFQDWFNFQGAYRLSWKYASQSLYSSLQVQAYKFQS